MSLVVVTEFIKGATVRIVAYVYDEDGVLVNPTHASTPIRLTLYVEGVTAALVEDAAMASTGDTGIYDYYYATDSDNASGWYRGIIEVMDGAGPVYTSKDSFGFRIG